MTEKRDDESDEIPLGYLEPSTKPGSIGHLGHYKILHVLGRGAFGIVLKAFDEKLQRVVAIKVLSPEMAGTSPARRRFLREARSAAAVRHEHVVNIYAVEEQPLPYLVMEYIPGETLQQRLDKKGPLDVSEVLRMGAQIADGLAAAHKQDLIHRDIKPGNILLEAGVHERVKITDFGLARAADDASMTQSGLIAGTPMYMAPEQALGQKLDQRADLFSLGSVLYQMVSGRPPFRAANTLAVLKRVTEDTPRPITEVIPETPQWLCDIIAKLHAKNPDERYQSAQEVADVLADCETQLKANAKLQDFSRIPKVKPTSGSGNWKWVAVVALSLPIFALGLTQVTGVMQLFRGSTPEKLPIVGDGPVTPNLIANTEGWVQLFNGKNLSGWTSLPGSPGAWQVEEGVLIGRGPRQSYLYSERGDYKDFHLRAEVKINADGNAGVHFRVTKPVVMLGGAPTGYEAQIAGSHGDSNRTGSLFKFPTQDWLVSQVHESPAADDSWFVFEIIVQGRRVITRVNDKTLVNIEGAGPASGHLALQVFENNVVVQFRKIEINELPAADISSPSQSNRQFASNEWIDVIPLIDPQADKWGMHLTGRNDWRIEQGELIAGADDKASKLLLPLDAAWQSFECEVEFTRRSGSGGINVNIPTSVGDCPVVLGPPKTTGVFLGRNGGGVVLNSDIALVTEQRTTLRFDVRRESNQDHISVWVNDAAAGTWQGDRASIATQSNEGYPIARRMSLWVHAGGNEFVFHRIRVRILDGGTADTLRPFQIHQQFPPSRQSSHLP